MSTKTYFVVYKGSGKDAEYTVYEDTNDASEACDRDSIIRQVQEINMPRVLNLDRGTPLNPGVCGVFLNDSDPTWVTIYGYHVPDRCASITHEFRTFATNFRVVKLVPSSGKPPRTVAPKVSLRPNSKFDDEVDALISSYGRM